MRLKKTYKEFIKESSEFIDEKTIKEVFIDLIDMDFTIKFYDRQGRLINSDTDNNNPSKWFIDIKKTVDSQYGYIENEHSYGVTNLEPMKLDINKILDILQDAKETLMSMEYTVGYEIEFNFNDQSQFFISCHIQHNDTIGDRDDRLGNIERLHDEEPRGNDEY
jgi:hypothetical protein